MRVELVGLERRRVGEAGVVGHGGRRRSYPTRRATGRSPQARVSAIVVAEDDDGAAEQCGVEDALAGDVEVAGVDEREDRPRVAEIILSRECGTRARPSVNGDGIINVPVSPLD